MAKPGPVKGSGGRPRIEINQSVFDNLCKIQCTLAEISAFFGCSEDTIENRVKEWTENQKGFREYYQEKWQAGNISLRRIQFRLARKNATMAIWLGKQYLAQTDRVVNANLDLLQLDVKLTPEEEAEFSERLKSFLGIDSLEGI